MFENVKSGLLENTSDDIIISSGTKDVPVNAYSNRGIAKLTLPEGLENIGAYAFANNKLERIIIPSTVKNFGVACFAINNLKEVILKEGISEISKEMFFKNNLENIVLPSSLRKIGEGAFYHNKLSLVFIPSNVKEIGKNAFDNIDIEYDGILITKEEIKEYGCENIIDLANKKKNNTEITIEKNDSDNSNLSNSTENENIKFKSFYSEEPKKDTPFDNLTRTVESNFDLKIEELKMKIELDIAIIKTKETLLKKSIDYKEEIISAKNYLLSNSSDGMERNYNLFKTVLSLIQIEEQNCEQSILEFREELNYLYTSVERKKRLLEKLINDEQTMISTANNIANNYGIKI